MITWSIRILGWILCIACVMSGHWGWAIFFGLIGMGFYIKKDGELI